MKRILCLMLALIFLSGCALSTIRSPRKSSTRTVSEPVVKRESFFTKIMPKSSTIGEKEEILPLGKEEIK